jgi:tRNA(Ile)-lysidine synthase
MIETTELEGKKNLLAFSGGVDSTALFFLLLKHGIKFDIAIVNYNTREQSKEEVSYAKELSLKYNLECFILDAQTIEKNFEAKAREIRYTFFQKLIKQHSYDNLLTAHHLSDRFEWMLMQFCKGAGCVELAGMQRVQKREFYTLIRPLLHLDKTELYEYLYENKIKFFEDESNKDTQIKRNDFRHNYARPLLDKYLNGIKQSFKYLDADREAFVIDVEFFTLKEFTYFEKTSNTRADIYNIDTALKSIYKYMLSANEKEQLKRCKTLVVGRKFVINKDRYIFIAPYIKNTDEAMDVEFKEMCRVLEIEPKLRPFLYQNRDILQHLIQLGAKNG